MKKNIFLNPKGYTLVEMLAVIIVFSVIGGIIAVIFMSSLRGSNKANITNEVRQNGNYALEQMAKMITYAEGFNGISSDGVEYFGDCYNIEASTPYHYLKLSSFDGGEVIFTCKSGEEAEIASNGASLIDDDTVDGIVEIDSCKFTCDQPSLAQSPTIGISFTLSQKSESSFFEHKANILFETTVVMRNASK